MSLATKRSDGRQPRSQRTREAILAAATQHFLEDGYRSTSVAAIASDAGVTDAGLLYHFPTKEDLVLTVLAREDEREDALLAEIYASPGPELIRRIRRWGDVMEESRLLSALRASLSGECLLHDSAIKTYFRARYDRLLGQITSSLRAAQDRGEVRADVDAQLEARLLLAAMDGARLQYFFSDGARSMADLVEFAVDGMVRRLAPEGGPG